MSRLLALLLLFTASYADAEESGKACLNIPGRGPDVVKIIKTCEKGDVILLDGRHVPYLCDFDSAIINYGGNNRYACVFLGAKRQLREGSQY
jgi:hypothetical protein